MFGRLRRGYLLLFAICALALLGGLYSGVKSPGAYFNVASHRTMVTAWVFPAVLWAGWLSALVTVRRIERPTVTILRMLRRNRHWLLRGLLLMALVLPASEAISSIKQAIPRMVPFYADPVLARVDRALFLGHDPWRLTHAVFGPVATAAMDRLYVLWFLIMMGLLGWYICTRDQKLQLRGLLSYLLTWCLLGNVAALAFASVGPCFYEIYYGDPHFRPLIDALRASDRIYRLESFKEMDWLYRNRQVARFGAGISAMPSLHVAIAQLMFLTVRQEVRARWVAWLAGAYVAVLWIASVHLGWHYAIDGLAGILGAWAMWCASGRFVERLERTAPALTLPAPVPSGRAALT